MARHSGPDPFTLEGPDVVLAVRLRPGASANRVEGSALLDDGGVVLRVRVTAVPEKGKANAALIKLLAKSLGLAKSQIIITQGALDRRKTLRIEGGAAALPRLKALL